MFGEMRGAKLEDGRNIGIAQLERRASLA